MLIRASPATATEQAEGLKGTMLAPDSQREQSHVHVAYLRSILARNITVLHIHARLIMRTCLTQETTVNMSSLAPVLENASLAAGIAVRKDTTAVGNDGPG
jgi:hypothetical protein